MARKDAERNRDRLLEVAHDHLTAADGKVSLEGIAREAGVGIGTLYRHFPTREDLVAAVYRAERARLAASARTLLEAHDPDTALRLWFDAFAAYLGAKREMAEALRPVATSRAESRAELTPALQLILDAGGYRASGEDVLAALVGIHLATDSPEQTERLTALLLAGLAT